MIRRIFVRIANSKIMSRVCCRERRYLSQSKVFKSFITRRLRGLCNQTFCLTEHCSCPKSSSLYQHQPLGLDTQTSFPGPVPAYLEEYMEKASTLAKGRAVREQMLDPMQYAHGIVDHLAR
jgi:hypothetical protein